MIAQRKGETDGQRIEGLLHGVPGPSQLIASDVESCRFCPIFHPKRPLFAPPALAKSSHFFASRATQLENFNFFFANGLPPSRETPQRLLSLHREAASGILPLVGSDKVLVVFRQGGAVNDDSKRSSDSELRWAGGSDLTRRVFALMAVAVLAVPHASIEAQIFTWTGGASGTWSNSSTNWSGATTSPWTLENGASSTAFFDTTSTATIVSDIYLNAITLNRATTVTTDNLSASPRTVYLVGPSPTITLASGHPALGAGTTLSSFGSSSSKLSGTSGLTILSAGGTARRLALNGVNTGLTGGITTGTGVRLEINASTGGASSLGNNLVTMQSGTLYFSSGGYTLSNQFSIKGGFLSVNSTPTFNGAIDMTGDVSFSAGSTNTPTYTMNGIISNSAPANVSIATGSGSVVLVNANTYSGTTTVTSGTLVLKHGSALQNSTLGTASLAVVFDQSVTGRTFTIGGLAAASGTLSLQDNASTPNPILLNLGGNHASTSFGGTLTGGGSLKKIGTGGFTLSGSSTYTGSTIVSTGTLVLGASGSFDTSSEIVVGDALSSGAVLDLTAKTGGVAGSFTLLRTQTLKGKGTVDLAGGDLVALGTLAPGNSPGNINVIGDLVWTGTNAGGYQWEINDAMGSAGTHWDLITVSGVLDLTALSPSNRYLLDLTTLDASNTLNPMQNYSPGTNYTWSLVNASSVLLSDGTAAAGTDITSLFDVSFANWKNDVPTAGNYSVRVASGGGIALVIVPEPGTALLGSVGIAIAGWSLRRRRRGI